MIKSLLVIAAMATLLNPSTTTVNYPVYTETAVVVSNENFCDTDDLYLVEFQMKDGNIFSAITDEKIPTGKTSVVKMKDMSKSEEHDALIDYIVID